MSINSLSRDISRRDWLKVATRLGALGLMSPQQSNTVGQLLAKEETSAAERSLVDDPPKLFKDSAAALFNLKGEDPKLLLRTGGRDVVYEILRLTPQKSFANKTYSVKGEKGWDYVHDLRELAMYITDANDPKHVANHFAVKNLRKANSPKFDLDDLVFFGMNVRSAWLASVTAGATAAGWSSYTLPRALELINASIEILGYHQSTPTMRRNIEKVIANQLFGETATNILSKAFEYKVERDTPTTIVAKYKAGKSFLELEMFSGSYDAGEKRRLSELQKLAS